MKKMLKKYKDIIGVLVLGVVAWGAYKWVHNVATEWRGYEAIGGEMFIPFIILLHKEIWSLIVEPFKVVRND